MGKKALVLSGGSIKGAFQAGALKAVFESGFKPDLIYGISVGALNGGYMATEMTSIVEENNGQLNDSSYLELGNRLTQYWIDNVRVPKDLIKRKNVFTLGYEFVANKFDGILKIDPLEELIYRSTDKERLKRSPIALKVGALNLESGSIFYVDQNHSEIIEYILASAAIPIIMPAKTIHGNTFYDGGIRDVAPLDVVIDAGADEIMVVLCQAAQLDPTSGKWNPKKLIQLTDRLMETTTNELVNNDIKTLEWINKMVPENSERINSGPLEGKRKIKFTVIRPDNQIKVAINKFATNDIQGMIEQGYEKAARQLNLFT